MIADLKRIRGIKRIERVASGRKTTTQGIESRYHKENNPQRQRKQKKWQDEWGVR